MSQVPERLHAALADRYALERELGAGGMATVFLAEDLKHKRRVAVKVLKPELAAVLGAERFVQEITTTASLSHPHILPLFDSGTADGFLFYVMPFIEGETLRDKLNRETQLSVDEAVRIASEVADALDYAHRHGVVHRDIKPENILLQDGRPMVGDFGIALAVSAAAGGRMTETGLSLGTPHYMSPEQATAEKEITARSDVYSLASVLYEMLAGQPPHQGGSAQQVIMKIVTDEARPVTELRRSVPPHIAAAVAQSLEKLPADRFTSAAAFSAALANPAFAPSVMRSAAAGRSSNRRERLAWITAAAALLSTGVLAMRLMRAPEAAIEGASWLVDLGIPDSAQFVSGLALSADGSILAWGGPRQIWTRAAGSTSPVAMAGTEGACCPALSPDGAEVAFVRGSELFVIPRAGGAAKLGGSGFSPGDDLAWTIDGHVVGVSNAQGTSGTGGLIRVAAGGGAVERFTVADTITGEYHWSPRALPAPGGVLFTIVPADLLDPVGPRIAVVGPAGGAHTVLMPGRAAAYADPGHLIVSRNDGSVVAVPFDLGTRRLTGDPVPLFIVPQVPGTFSWRGYSAVARSGTLVFVGGDDETGGLAWRTRDGRSEPADFDASFASGAVAISPDGGTIAFQALFDRSRATVEIRDRRTRANSRIESEGARVDDVAFTADGQAMVFRLIAPGRSGIYRTELRRPAEHTRLLLDPGAFDPSLSPDGRTLYFLRTVARGLEFVSHPLEPSGAAARVLAVGDARPSVSPDGRWLAFIEGGERGRQLFVRSLDPGRSERWLVSQAASGAIRWARNGQTLYFIARDTLMAAQVSGGESFAVGRIESLFPLRLGPGLEFDVGPDGRILVPNRLESSALRLMMFDDWHRLIAPRPK